MPTPIDKIALLRSMALNAMDLEAATKTQDWPSARASYRILLLQIKQFEDVLAAEPPPQGYTGSCECLNCLPPKGIAND